MRALAGLANLRNERSPLLALHFPPLLSPTFFFLPRTRVMWNTRCVCVCVGVWVCVCGVCRRNEWRFKMADSGRLLTVDSCILTPALCTKLCPCGPPSLSISAVSSTSFFFFFFLFFFFFFLVSLRRLRLLDVFSLSPSFFGPRGRILCLFASHAPPPPPSSSSSTPDKKKEPGKNLFVGFCRRRSPLLR